MSPRVTRRRTSVLRLPTARVLLASIAVLVAFALVMTHTLRKSGEALSSGPIFNARQQRAAVLYNEPAKETNAGTGYGVNESPTSGSTLEGRNRGMVVCAGGQFINRAIALILTLRNKVC